MPILFVTMLIDFAGYSVLVPVLPIYADKLGATPFEVGMIVTFYALTQLLFLPMWGWASDRIGRRPAILGSLAGTTLAYGILIVADSLAEVYLSRILAGFFAASLGTAQAMVTDLTPPEKRAQGMGVLGAALGVGFVIGPGVGGLLGGLSPDLPWLPFAAVMVASFLNLVAAWFVLPESRPGDRGAWQPGEILRLLIPTPFRVASMVHERRIGIFLYLFFHLFAAFAALEAMFTLFMAKRYAATTLAAGQMFMWIGVWIALTQGFALRPLSNRMSETSLVVVGLLVMGVGLALMPWMPSMAALYVLAPFVAVGNGLAFPALASLYSKACGSEQAGELLGQSQSMATTGRIVGPMWAGFAMGNVGVWLAARLPSGSDVFGLSPESFALGSPFLGAGVLTLIGLGLFVVCRGTLVVDATAD
ncbi:MAG: MFS transporter [Myxococcales bacterium]|nr:MFS transporter [Myxococcales bacterium]